MSELSRLFLPLDTGLSATPLSYLLLFVAIPLIAALIISAGVKVTSSRHQQPSDTDYADPVWAGPEPTGGTPGHEQQKQQATLEEDGATARSGRTGQGGASARW
ncbi:MAG TPA: hypothetical protein VEQ66_02980 [Propionibacteriaceae bacterium]|nr:hypothetical protein [Propionibacteriaceae bacterium]